MRNELSRRRRVCKMVLFGCVLSVGLAASAGAVEVGERIGPLELTTLDGPRFVMDNYDKRVGTVIAFLSSRCPVTDKMAERINYVQEEYRHDDILWVGIGANPAESGDELRDFCQKRGMIFPFYQDPQGKIRKRFGPKVTPEVFLLNANSEVVYHGADRRQRRRRARGGNKGDGRMLEQWKGIAGAGDWKVNSGNPI